MRPSSRGIWLHCGGSDDYWVVHGTTNAQINTSLHHHLPALRSPSDRDDADRCMRWFLSLQGMRSDAEAQAWVIAACFAPMARCHARQSSRNVPASAERRAVASNMMSDRQRCEQQDWAADWLTLAALWGLPTVAMLLALLLDPIWRAVVWIAMLASMGAACVINACRCGRTHCRYTGLSQRQRRHQPAHSRTDNHCPHPVVLPK